MSVRIGLMRLSLIALSALFAAALLVKRTTGPQAIVRQIAIEWNKGVAFACIKIDRGYQCGLVSSIEHGPRLLRYPFQFLLRHCMDLAFTYDLWISLYAYVSNNYVGATNASLTRGAYHIVLTRMYRAARRRLSASSFTVVRRIGCLHSHGCRRID
jgi:hypothetical protein